MSTKNNPPITTLPGYLAPQVGMPHNVTTRSKEIIYDALEKEVQFIFNPYGPRKISLSRPNQHW